MTNLWDGDRLGYQEFGEPFTNLVQSIDGGKVISIEAGFGRGKTFFRQRWADHLRQEGEIVIELDVQQSDHSGDPVITLVGALVEALPKLEKSKGEAVFDSAKKIAVIGGKIATKAFLKSGADVLTDAITSSASDELEGYEALQGIIDGAGNEMSKAAGQLITSQMAAEQVRKTELPEQLNALRAALVEEAVNDRVIVIIDELDRCHPEYAIAFLEAMKLVFSQAGFVFCLMVNANYLENLAQHRFGVAPDDEKYLDKFVDIRLKLLPKEGYIKSAVSALAHELPLAIPYGDEDAFSILHAANLAGELAEHTKLSMRKIKRILLKVELALRCYSDQPLDASLLVFMAFRDEVGDGIDTSLLPRSSLTPEEGEKGVNDFNRRKSDGRRREPDYQRIHGYHEQAPELFSLPSDRYQYPKEDERYHDWAKIFKFLAPHYIPSHRDALDTVASVAVSSE